MEYHNNVDCVWFIKPTLNPKKRVVVVLDKIDLEDSYDWLYFYEGLTTSRVSSGSLSFGFSDHVLVYKVCV